MADVTYYVALPFVQDDSGSPAAGAAEECQSSSGAIRRAEVLSRAAGSIGAVAFSRTGDPMIGEFSDAQLLKKFGDVPDDLSGTLSCISFTPCAAAAPCAHTSRCRPAPAPQPHRYADRAWRRRPMHPPKPNGREI